MIKTIEATNNHYTVSDAGIIYKDGIEVPIKHQRNGYCIVPIKLIFGTRHYGDIVRMYGNDTFVIQCYISRLDDVCKSLLGK